MRNCLPPGFLHGEAFIMAGSLRVFKKKKKKKARRRNVLDENDWELYDRNALPD